MNKEISITELSNEITVKQHLKIVAKSLLKVFVVVLALSIVVFVFSDSIFSFASSYYGIPKMNIVTLSPFEQISSQLYISLAIPLILLLPIFLYGLGNYVKPILSEKNSKMINKYIVWISIVGFIGLAFGVLVMAKEVLSLMLSYQTFNAMWSLSSIIKSVLFMGLSMALILEIAPLIVVLNKIKVIDSRKLSHYRLHVAFALSILTCVIVPSPDLVTYLILLLPMYLSFEVGLQIANRFNKSNDVNIQMEKEVYNVRTR